MLKLYLGNVEYLVGAEISSEKIHEAKRLNLYDALHVVNIQNFNHEEKFDTLIALEVLHGLSAGALMHIEGLVKKNGSVILALPALPSGIDVKDLPLREAIMSIDTCLGGSY
uniref:Class I SAM-dependent methyltransferase n=1 Tax=Fervidicoccus fontis TaxID=683846 RepID=A0A7J3SLQ9_9CREN